MKDARFFSKKISPACVYCKNGRTISGGKEVFCLKKGIVNANDSCRSYKYDVLKREPNAKTIAKEYRAEDFVL